MTRRDDGNWLDDLLGAVSGIPPIWKALLAVVAVVVCAGFFWAVLT